MDIQPELGGVIKSLTRVFSGDWMSSNHYILRIFNNEIGRSANPVSSWGGGGGIIGQILPKFAISRVWGYAFSIK